MNASRNLAAFITVLALIGVGWQFHLNGTIAEPEPWLPRIWGMARYYTYIANIMVILALGRIALGRTANTNQMTAITLSIIMVGIIYRLLLAPAEPKAAPDWYPDFLMHVAVPVLVPLWWLAFCDKTLHLKALPLWLIPPALYCLYSLIRGWIAGSYPYFFFDIGQFGLTQVVLNCVGLVVVFALCGLVLWGVARLMRRSA